MARIKSKQANSSSTPVRDAETTKMAILDAAEQEFAVNGLAGARTETIAAQTGVTKAMIFYYFESKEKLYEAVLERAYLSRLRSVQKVAFDDMEPDEAVRQLLRHFIFGARSNPNWPRILMFEAMQNKGKYYSKIGITSFYGLIAGVIERGIKKGVFRDVDVMHTAVNVVGLCNFYFCSRENLKHLWSDKDMLSDEMIEQHAREATDLVIAGLKR
jgi:TetR/AcrR family transcriptional regulator